MKKLEAKELLKQYLTAIWSDNVAQLSLTGWYRISTIDPSRAIELPNRTWKNTVLVRTFVVRTDAELRYELRCNHAYAIVAVIPHVGTVVQEYRNGKELE